jgi:hypothetical protein
MTVDEQETAAWQWCSVGKGAVQVDALQLASGVTALTREVEHVSRHGKRLLLWLAS